MVIHNLYDHIPYFLIQLQVVECVNSDALVIKTADGAQKKIHFSSLRPPR